MPMRRQLKTASIGQSVGNLVYRVDVEHAVQYIREAVGCGHRAPSQRFFSFDLLRDDHEQP